MKASPIRRSGARCGRPTSRSISSQASDAHHGDAGEPRDAAKVEDKDDDRTPDQGGENAGTQHVGAPVWDGRRVCYLFGTLPKRRSRWLYSVSAAAISASSKSGQKVGVA